MSCLSGRNSGGAGGGTMAAIGRQIVSPRKRRLLELLNTPIKFGKIHAAKRETFIAAETERRIAAALELYDIDPSTPEDAKWCALAMYLLGAHFPGCSSLARHPGGAPKNSWQSYSEIVSAFEEYCKTARTGSKTARALSFMKGRGGKIQVGNETITTAKSFLNMYRRSKKVAL
jgi:hypothetical protein